MALITAPKLEAVSLCFRAKAQKGLDLCPAVNLIISSISSGFRTNDFLNHDTGDDDETKPSHKTKSSIFFTISLEDVEGSGDKIHCCAKKKPQKLKVFVINYSIV